MEIYLFHMNLTLKWGKYDVQGKEGADSKNSYPSGGDRETGAGLFWVKRMMGGDVKGEKWKKEGRQTGEKTERSGDGQRAICEEEETKGEWWGGKEEIAVLRRLAFRYRGWDR